MSNPQVCIIGAGSTGIAAAKTLKDHGISFDCFEKGSGIGGNWRYNNDNGMSSAYRSLHINTNRDIMGYSDYPLPRDYPMFPHHSQIIRYFDDYVEHFGIRPFIHFRTTVLHVEPKGEEGYLVRTESAEGEVQERLYKNVLVANGHHWNPRFPTPAFPGTFTGETLHSHHYKTPDQIVGKKLLVVGIGNSAVDIACEAARQYGEPVTISTRSGAYILPNWLMSRPFDSLANPLTSRLPLSLQRLLLRTSLFLARGRQQDYGVPVPDRPILSEHPTISQDLLNLSGRGLVRFKPNIQAFEGKEVIFTDGSRDTFDMIIYATGYKVSFPFFSSDFIDVESTNDLQLYQRVVHPDHPGLYFLGLIQPLGAIMPLAELQSKWVAKLISGACRLPNREEMIRSIEEEAQMVRQRYKRSARHTLQVDFYPYRQRLERVMRID